MSARWYKRCGADFIHGTMMLTLEEKGAYSLCLDLIYDRGGPIPDEPRWLAGVCGVSLRKWAAIRDRLLSLGKIVSDGEHLSNSRADLEMVSSELHARKLAESGAKGGRKRAENAGQANKSNDLAEAPLKLYREDKRREESPPVAPRKRGEGAGINFPSDWVLPPVSELTPKAKACAEQWTVASYETEGEGFMLYWKQSRKRRPDWLGTWCAWVIRQHSKVMRDQKFGNAPVEPPKTMTQDQRRESDLSLAKLYDKMGRTSDAEDLRSRYAAPVGEIASKILRAAGG